MNLVTGYENRKPRIEMVPLVDVIFLLVVFFIYTIVLAVPTSNLRINLPTGKGIVENDKLLIISINADNHIYIDDKITTLEGAVEKVSNIKKSLNIIKVVIRGDKKSDLGTTIELLSALRMVGVENVSFQLERKEK